MSHGTRSASSEWSRGAFAEFTRAQGRNLLLIPPYSACIFAHLQAARAGPAELSPFPPPFLPTHPLDSRRPGRILAGTAERDPRHLA